MSTLVLLLVFFIVIVAHFIVLFRPKDREIDYSNVIYTSMVLTVISALLAISHFIDGSTFNGGLWLFNTCIWGWNIYTWDESKQNFLESERMKNYTKPKQKSDKELIREIREKKLKRIIKNLIKK